MKLAALCVFLVVASVVALAGPVTYTYIGNPFNQFSNLTCPPDCAISGSFTLPVAIGDNFSGDINLDLTNSLFDFTDGNVDISFSNDIEGPIFFIQTNATGAIVNWSISLAAGGCVGHSTICNQLITSPASDGVSIEDTTSEDCFFLGIDCILGSAQNLNDPGTWSASSAMPSPEPSSLLLLSTGVLCLGPFICRACRGLLPLTDEVGVDSHRR